MGRTLVSPNIVGGATAEGVEIISPGGQLVTTVTQGNKWYVKPYSGSDNNTGTSPSTAFKTLIKAQAAATANQNDIVYLMAESNTASKTTDYQTTGLVWAKDGVHLIGVNGGSMIGSRSRIAQLASVKDIINLFTVSANNCSIANLEVYQGVASGTALAPKAVVVSGARNVFTNCQLSGIGDASADVAGARSLSITGGENTFKDCFIGLDTVVKGTAEASVDIGAVPRTVFDGCMFSTWTSNTAFKFVIATSIDRFVIFKNCTFSSTTGIASAVTMTGAITNTTPNGKILIQNSSLFGVTQWTTADDAGTLVVGVDQSTSTNHKMNIGTAVDAT